MKPVPVFARPGTLAGWPANNGLWCWEGKEILVGFVVGDYVEQPGHNIAEPYRLLTARSTDQGETWVTSAPQITSIDIAATALDFADPNFALRVAGTGYHGSAVPTGAFYFTQDRGHTWRGPTAFEGLRTHPALHGRSITARTDYVVESSHSCLVMMSARGSDDLSADRAFGARTTDGGRTFQFVAWVVPPEDPHRAVMPATVPCGSGKLVTTIRRRETGTQRCWIDAYASTDAGGHWRWMSMVTDTGGWNGNPPALTRLRDGRLCCVYGERNTCRMLAKISADDGQTWHAPSILRDDFHCDAHNDPDVGYARVCQRADGQMLALYYWATRALPNQHIAATVWQL